ncbi:PLP-dependent aminotransferase family protein [Gorillibacterium sp. sgz5001074]|uniref:MocR-like pyridoxine biosynthesis transcription factor PdxR n=1 Tax=Gorillibacterium sp. sgz5001074 TaxID=3446695 RepID=UPI003F67DDEB
MDLTPILDPTSPDALYIQLYRSIRGDILAGRIPSGARLPSIRKLCARLALSRTPVALAYEQLLAEGYIVSRPRSGLFVAELEAPADAGKPPARDQQPPASSGESGQAPRLRAYHAPADARPGIDFGYGAVDVSAFPLTRWRRLLNRSFRPEQARTLLYGELQGERRLREQLAIYLHQSRGVRCTADDIVIGAGTYHSLDLLFQLLEGEKLCLATEEAVNDGVQALFRRYGYTGARLLPLPLEEDGIRLDPLGSGGVRAVYVTPSHQFPYGMILSAAKRLQLLQWAAENGAYLIENDYDGEFRYGGRPIPSLQGMDRADRTVYVGTFSKALTPSFRLSYMVLPKPLLAKFRQGAHSYDQLASPLFQVALRLFMEEGDLERHVRRMKGLYQRKHDLLLEELRARLDRLVEPIGTGSGLHILAKCLGSFSEAELIGRASARGVRVYPVSVYALSQGAAPPSTVLLGFGGLSEEDIRRGVRLLEEAWME